MKSKILAFIITIVGAQLPGSPFGTSDKICSTGNGKSYSVEGYTGTPFLITPFVDTFIDPKVQTPQHKACRGDGHCLFTYNIDIIDIARRPFDRSVPSCRAFPGTWFLSYNSQIPGPTLVVPTGHESLVRFNNKISNRYFKEAHKPCLNGRRGQPISVHLHGSASLAPFDGWAEDITCLGETKDYVYPNNRPVTGWYHDHALHITAMNAYFGLAGGYVISSKKKHGGCGEPWNLEDVDERLLILSDKVLTNRCQFLFDHANVHKNDLYGDINLVSGIPFPNILLDPKWYRFRLLNAAVSRPYLVKIKNSKLEDIAQDICYVIASDGGYRITPIRFPASGIIIGVAERYEIVCDFTKYRGQTLYLWNDKDEAFMKDVPYFCYSHLIAKFVVSSRNVFKFAVPDFTSTNPAPVQPLNKVLNETEIAKAREMADNGQAHREMVFGRSGGQWTINGETWDTFKFAAEDVGQNTWEVWHFKTGGGWFHPIHLHLVDFFLLRRDRDGGVKVYESNSAKDVFYLGPSQEVWAIARFGAHKGDYMFHCHNLIHEDNDMMRAMRIISTEGGKNVMSADRIIKNPLHGIVYNNFKYVDPMLGETAARPSGQVAILGVGLAQTTLNKNLYRIFYPTTEDLATYTGYDNPWKVDWCKAN